MKPPNPILVLSERRRPLHAQVVLYTLLAAGLALGAYFTSHRPTAMLPGTRQRGISLLSLVLPDEVLFQPSLPWLCFAVYVVAAALWVARRGTPWAGWAAAASFNAVVALYLENSHQVTHVAHLTAMILWVFAAWYHFCADELRAADAAGRFYAEKLCPRWVPFLGVFAVGWFYGLSGWTKLLVSGLGWANGVSMQLWTHLWGDPNSPLTRLALADRNTALVLQVGALAAECAALPAVWLRPLRPWVGLALVGFHAGQISVFGWGFHANAVLIALLFLPFERWLDGSRSGQPPQRPHDNIHPA